MGSFVLDFYCPQAKLVIEVDGWGHNLGDQPARDQCRDAWLAAQGLTLLRIPADEVLRDPDAVANAIVLQAMSLIKRTNSSPPLRSGGGGGEADGGGSLTNGRRSNL